MCRMFAYVGDSQADLEGLFAALKDAARNDDTMLWKDKGSRQHRDGWGCAIYTGSSLLHHRTSTPIFEDGFKLPKIGGLIYAIFHARAASPGSPTGSPAFSHPFTASTSKETMFLAHNGSMREPKPPPTMVDSEMVLSEIVELGNLATAKEGLEEMTESALNLFVLSIDRGTGKAKLECLNYWKDEQKSAYYQLFGMRMTGGLAVFSSTMKSALGGEPCERGAIMTLEPG